ncbi:LysR family transcriptional regulator [Streptomyces sp. SID13726]|uniref:LysR family transcriptional regulator n=1 Tax=Streptomyces sp. SID13726 TaxID=2706058 RepID=UPI0013B90B32|nr:LysR family transcriptional regulator [Streptomyces sp. SID13726]NEA98523.1 LysR family transcriptional regulator [Streptomyces sp. SID13726]
MVTLHQLRCFVATVEHGSFTRAADALGLAQPSLAQQIRLLERGMSTALFQRVGRGVVPTEAALALEGYARQALDAVEQGSRAVADADRAVTGTIRFGLFGAAHLYLETRLVADMRERFPSARLSLVGQNSMDTIELVRRGQLEAALVALPIDDSALSVKPVTRDEVVYVTADPDRVQRAVTCTDLAAATLVLSEATWGDADYTRQQLRNAVQSVGGTLQAAIEVENVETALEVAALGLADAITARSVVRRYQDKLPAQLHCFSLEPRLYDHFAIVYRHNAVLSRPVQAVIEMAAARLRQLVRSTRA